MRWSENLKNLIYNRLFFDKMVIIIGQSSDSISAEERNLQSLLELAQIDKRVNGEISVKFTRTVQSFFLMSSDQEIWYYMKDTGPAFNNAAYRLNTNQTEN